MAAARVHREIPVSSLLLSLFDSGWVFNYSCRCHLSDTMKTYANETRDMIADSSCNRGRNDLLKFAAENNIPVSSTPKAPWSMDDVRILNPLNELALW